MNRRDFVQIVSVAAVGTAIPWVPEDDFQVEVPFTPQPRPNDTGITVRPLGPFAGWEVGDEIKIEGKPYLITGITMSASCLEVQGLEVLADGTCPRLPYADRLRL